MARSVIAVSMMSVTPAANADSPVKVALHVNKVIEKLLAPDIRC